MSVTERAKGKGVVEGVSTRGVAEGVSKRGRGYCGGVPYGRRTCMASNVFFKSVL